ncbi:MAG: hypothetical protein FWD45_05570, partial [Coriobacteriia bacterium]|nr:hypothetical protein [Coriobacteriia bacterium]
MDLSCGSEQVVHSLGRGDYSDGSWYLQYIDSVYYAGNKAWFVAVYSFIENDISKGTITSEISRHIVTCIDLGSGKREEINELSLDYGADGYCELQLVSNDYVVYETQRYSQERLSPRDFYSAFEAGEFPQYSESL